MPSYEYRCRACGATFEQTRPMSESSVPTPCPEGHSDTVKLFSAVAVGNIAAPSDRPPARGSNTGGGGGCCGGGCCS
jgi:putative FmdB family regulatory protein